MYQIKGRDETYSCLSDSGSMIPIVKQSLLQRVNVDNLGLIKLRSAFGQIVQADLVRLEVRFCLSSELQFSPFLPPIFAVVKS